MPVYEDALEALHRSFKTAKRKPKKEADMNGCLQKDLAICVGVATYSETTCAHLVGSWIYIEELGVDRLYLSRIPHILATATPVGAPLSRYPHSTGSDDFTFR